MSDLTAWIKKLPKIELHLHIEGTLEPELAFSLAKRNKIQLPFDSVEELAAAYQFDNLQSFLDLYYACCDVLQTEKDFYDLTWAYLERVKKDHVVHTEIFFDPQTHTARDIPFEVIYKGIHSALADAEKRLGITSKLIMCFLRHLSEEDALHTLEQATPFLDGIIGVGLDSGEQGNPPSKFTQVFAKARELGLKVVAHAGEEGPASYIEEALDILKAERIDHGVRCVESPELVQRLAQQQIPLTVCPLSNVRLRVFEQLSDHNLKELLRQNVRITLNSDDPAYFGGYMNDNFIQCYHALNLDKADVLRLCHNAIDATFLNQEQKEVLRAQLINHENE